MELLKSIDREIGGKTYRLQELPAKAGRAMLVRLLKLAGPSVSSALKGLSGEDISLGGLTPSALGDALLELTKALNESDFEEICKVFFGQTQVLNTENGNFVKLNEYVAFAGNYGELMQLLAAHVEHNYSSFFAGLGLTRLQS